MRKSCALLLFVLFFPLRGHALAWEAGAIGGQGPCFAYGSYLDSRQAALAEAGSLSPGALGSSKGLLFPGWSVGAYSELVLLEWLALRTELRASFQGVSNLALTSSGGSYDNYGFYFYGASLPLLTRFKIPVGPGAVCLSVGPYVAVTAGLAIVDQYSSFITVASLSPWILFGLTGGAGYALSIGRAVLSLEARVDWALTSAADSVGLGGEVFPVAGYLMLGWGIQLGGGAK